MTDELKGFRGTPGPYAHTRGTIHKDTHPILKERHSDATHLCQIIVTNGDYEAGSANGRLLAKSYELALFVQRLVDVSENNLMADLSDFKDRARTLLASVIGDSQ